MNLPCAYDGVEVRRGEMESCMITRRSLIGKAALERLRRRHPDRIDIHRSEAAVMVRIDAWCDGNEAEAVRVCRDVANAWRTK